MEAAAAVIAERGFESATMAEIATRAGAQIGSLYRFFPNKEVLADALMQRHRELVDGAFGKIESRAMSVSAHDLADALVDLLVELHPESRAMVALLDARSEWSAKPAEFRNAAIGHIARIVMLRAPHLRPETARDVAVVLLHNMKTMKALTLEQGLATSAGAPAELREMNRLYLASKLLNPTHKSKG
ncbi:Transcriptional regulator, TetR family [Fimbriiglobus ruber]|uniref:Transcriptional regulator, TetR family n=2 Tax=Fimbriiglobus ruber TaxID=1908690 RepID=A0A225DH84_9BACT|nr:Transcriptional regulator, TetR family [Fimbriiglobus ruber]